MPPYDVRKTQGNPYSYPTTVFPICAAVGLFAQTQWAHAGATSLVATPMEQSRVGPVAAMHVLKLRWCYGTCGPMPNSAHLETGVVVGAGVAGRGRARCSSCSRPSDGGSAAGPGLGLGFCTDGAGAAGRLSVPKPERCAGVRAAPAAADAVGYDGVGRGGLASAPSSCSRLRAAG